jgi:hypothetical protein
MGYTVFDTGGAFDDLLVFSRGFPGPDIVALGFTLSVEKFKVQNEDLGFIMEE